MNNRIKAMKRKIERRGGMFFGLENLPEDIAEVFLMEILACPLCATADRPEGESIDKVLAGNSRTTGHIGHTH
jgi:hypothetical protein